MTLQLRWHDDVPADLAAIRTTHGPEACDEACDEARRLITSLPGGPLLGEWLEHHAATGDLSTCRKVAFGPDEIDGDGTNLGPSLRLVYRLLPSNTEARQIGVLAVAPRHDLVAYALAAARSADLNL